MLKLKALGIVALSIAMAAGVADTASAFATKNHKHLTYEQAWAACKKHVDNTLARDQQSQRYTRGAACMHTYGYRI